MCFRPAEVQINKCPECGKVNKPIAKECVECGAALNTGPADIICPICGISNPASASSCVNCGATEAEIMKAMLQAPSAPKAPGAPTAPAAPAPPAPGAPKPPAPPAFPKA